MPIAADEARNVARLAGLAPDDGEIAALAAGISAVIDHFASIREIDTTGVPALDHALEFETPFRKDVPGDPMRAATVLRAAPESNSERLTVPWAGVERSGG
jgi:aspartyl-tRNA(Asn)/glutamyl-tRNA(Gln) amidotransferase subunit C